MLISLIIISIVLAGVFGLNFWQYNRTQTLLSAYDNVIVDTLVKKYKATADTNIKMVEQFSKLHEVYNSKSTETIKKYTELLKSFKDIERNINLKINE